MASPERKKYYGRGASAARKRDEITEGPRSPIPVPRPRKAKGRAGMGYGVAKDSTTEPSTKGHVGPRGTPRGGNTPPKPKPKSKPSEGARGRGGMGHGATTRKDAPKSPPKKTTEKHVHASSTTPSKSNPPLKKGQRSGMYSSKASGGRGSAGKETAVRKKKAAQLKRSKSWAKRYATGGSDDRK